MSFSQLNLLYTVVLSLLIEIVLKKKRKKEEEKIVLKLQIVGLIICLKTGIICRALCNVKNKDYHNTNKSTNYTCSLQVLQQYNQVQSTSHLIDLSPLQDCTI